MKKIILFSLIMVMAFQANAQIFKYDTFQENHLEIFGLDEEHNVIGEKSQLDCSVEIILGDYISIVGKKTNGEVIFHFDKILQILFSPDKTEKGESLWLLTPGKGQPYATIMVAPQKLIIECNPDDPNDFFLSYKQYVISFDSLENRKYHENVEAYDLFIKSLLTYNGRTSIHERE